MTAGGIWRAERAIGTPGIYEGGRPPLSPGGASQGVPRPRLRPQGGLAEAAVCKPAGGEGAAPSFRTAGGRKGGVADAVFLVFSEISLSGRIEDGLLYCTRKGCCRHWRKQLIVRGLSRDPRNYCSYSEEPSRPSAAPPASLSLPLAFQEQDHFDPVLQREFVWPQGPVTAASLRLH